MCVCNGVIVGLGVGSCCIADKGTSSHSAIHGSDGFNLHFASPYLHFESDRQASELRSEKQNSNDRHAV